MMDPSDMDRLTDRLDEIIALLQALLEQKIASIQQAGGEK